MKLFNYLIFLGFSVLSWCQNSNDTIRLDDIVLSTKILNEFSTGQNIIPLADSLTFKQPSTATSFFQFNSPIHFKENGFGMVSSPSFRGTLASHTLVLWNGIPINSQFNGQVDFNAINLTGYNQIQIRPGGGSLLYGSGGLGGTIHLNQEFLVDNETQALITTSYGSFDTFRNQFSFRTNRGNFAYNLAFAHNYSDNDYQIDSGSKNNLNGKYQNYSLTFNASYEFKIGSKLQFFSEFFDGNRYLSITRPSESRGKYLDRNFKGLIQYIKSSENISHYFKGSFIREDYNYYQNRYVDNYSFGKSNSLQFSYESEITISTSAKLKPLFSVQDVFGDGTDIDNEKFQNVVAALEFKQSFNRFVYELGGRFQWHSVYKGQFLGQLGSEWRPIDYYVLKFSTSKNFRAPTLNDLYWTDSGNLQLEPEDAYQLEMTNQFKYAGFKFQFTGFYNDIRNLIQWRPRESGLWSPFNVGKAETYGLEFNVFYEKDLGSSKLSASSLNSFTVAKDKVSNNYLIYSPKWQSTTNIGFSIKRFGTQLQLKITDKVYTTTDNSAILDGSAITNILLEYAFGRNHELTVGFNAYNVFDQHYQTIQDRPMPGRYFQTVFNLSF